MTTEKKKLITVHFLISRLYECIELNAIRLNNAGPPIIKNVSLLNQKLSMNQQWPTIEQFNQTFPLLNERIKKDNQSLKDWYYLSLAFPLQNVDWHSNFKIHSAFNTLLAWIQNGLFIPYGYPTPKIFDTKHSSNKICYFFQFFVDFFFYKFCIKFVCSMRFILSHTNKTKQKKTAKIE